MSIYIILEKIRQIALTDFLLHFDEKLYFCRIKQVLC